MKFPAIVFLAVCGGMLFVGGTLIGSEVTLGIGLALWAGCALLILHSVMRFAADTWHDWRVRCYMKALQKRNPNPAPRYSRGAGLR